MNTQEPEIPICEKCGERHVTQIKFIIGGVEKGNMFVDCDTYRHVAPFFPTRLFYQLFPETEGTNAADYRIEAT